MFRKGSLLLLPYQAAYILILLFVTGFVVWFYRDIDATFNRVLNQFVRNQILIVEEFSQNIETRLEQLAGEEPYERLAADARLREHVDHMLSLFSTGHFRYVYILYVDEKGRLRYLADGSHEAEERGLFSQKFDADTDRWREAVKTRRPVYALQKDFTGLWVTFYYPLHLGSKRPYLLVFDVSIDTLTGFQQTLRPIRDLLKNLSIVLMVLLFSSILWSVLFYLQRKKNSIDPLTRLYNRNILPQIEARLDLAATSVILADIDHFKRINDRYGHDAGDRVLQVVSRVMLQSTRPEDVIIRYGGEEFLIFVNDLKERAKVLEVARRIHDQIAKTPVRYGGHTIRLTLSMGLVVHPGDGMDLEEALRQADKMLYIAKTTGRNRLVVFGEERGIERRLLYHEVQEAIESGGLFFEYQPIVRAKSHEVVKYEVLARLRGVDGRLYHPDAFIPPIHGTGLYRELGKRLLRHTFETIRRHGVALSINFDINDFLDETLFEILYDELAAHRAWTRHLTIELLEERHVENTDALIEKVERLKSLGIRIAVDDFGKGYAGINYILLFKPAVIKVDRSLVSQVLSHPDVPAILRSLVATSHLIGLQIVAEGVESEEIMQKMEAFGFDCLQGYYIAPPSVELSGPVRNPPTDARPSP